MRPGKITGTRHAHSFELLRASLGKICRTTDTISLFVEPVHTYLTETRLLVGHGPDLDHFNKTLAKIVDEQKGQGCGIRLFDVSGYHEINNSPFLGNVGQVAESEAYYEISHYKSAVAKAMILRFEEESMDADNTFGEKFGYLLTGGNIASQLQRMREDRLRFREVLMFNPVP